MPFSISDRLLLREITDPYRSPLKARSKAGGETNAASASSYTSVRGLYGDKAWINDLDIINELGGHTGCVNALSWSKSGKLLASGSDDTHVNIHTYQPESSTKPFNLATTIQTGHSANIFSVKFMPHSGDNTIVSCAGDGQVRIFDIEYAGRNGTSAHVSPSSTRHHSGVNLEELYRGVRFLSPGTTNARVYRSHSDRVKRIVTESSPHLFLTCSEDGEVRQWDLRQPSSAYPSPRRGQQIPPPLISYKRYQLDLNTISCSGNQPHYIVLGGVHLHAFLHDRRMLGRDIDAERGVPSSQSSTSGFDRDEELMGRATKCVRRFAPNGKTKMKRTDSGHITACKISDANPNEMIASWSGDHIYSFNLISSPDALDVRSGDPSVITNGSNDKKTAPSAEKKRKREVAPDAGPSSAFVEALERAEPRARSSGDEADVGGDVALRVRYGNGQSEDIPLESTNGESDLTRDTTLTASQMYSLKIGKRVSKIRRAIFSTKTTSEDSSNNQSQILGRRFFNDAISRAAALLPEMEEMSCSWGYPMSPSPETVSRQQAMRSARTVSCHFVQVCGVVARLLGGVLHTLDPVQTRSKMDRFLSVTKPPSSSSPWQVFCYTLLASIVAWLDQGKRGILEHFKDPSYAGDGCTVQKEAGEEAIDDHIIPYLLHLADTSDEQPRIVNVEANRFETDVNRVLFSSGREAVVAFKEAVAATESQSTEDATASDSPGQTTEPRLVFWGAKVARGLLLSAGETTTPSFVSHAFGGPTLRLTPDEGRSQEDVIEDESEEIVQQMSLVSNGNGTGAAPDDTRSQAQAGALSSSAIEEIIAASDLHAALREHGINVTVSESEDERYDDDLDLEYSPENSDTGDLGEVDEDMLGDDSFDEENEDDNDDNDDNDDYNEERSESGDSESEDDMNPRSFFGASAAYGRQRENVEINVPCSSHTRVYSGHCNVKTVKDVNFFGLEDEYVVSGSDSGHFFIWDRKTSKLLNVLQGDGEVVNVIQGHPYEPMLAVSGIDHTVKIFSPDMRAQARARRGIDLGTSTHRSYGASRLQMRSRIRNANSRGGSGMQTPNAADPATEAAAATAAWDEDDESSLDDERPSNGGLASCKRMQDSYQIMSQNDADRNGGMEDAIMTRSFLAQLAAHIHARRSATAAAAATTNSNGTAGNNGRAQEDGNDNGGDGEDDEGERTVVVGDDCIVM